MKTLFNTIHALVYRFLYGGSCIGCHAPGPALCQACLSKIRLSDATEHVGIYGIYDYGNPLVSEAVWSLKYSHRAGAAKLLAEKGSDVVTDIISEHLQSGSAQSVIFVPVPQYKKKTQRRGLNQSMLIAQSFASSIDGAHIETVLEKTKETVPQSHISDRRHRMNNISYTMRASKTIDKKTIYIVIDDVTTTGATFLEATRALKAGGAKHILSIALAHGYKRR